MTGAETGIVAGRRRRDWKSMALAALVLGLVGLTAESGAGDLDNALRDFELVPLRGSEAVPFILENLNAKRISLSDFKGRPVLLYFWATW